MSRPAGSGMSVRRAGTLVLLLCTVLTAAAARAQTTAASDGSTRESVRTDSDPTRPVFFSLRPEFYQIADGVDQRVLIARYDSVVLRSLHVGRGVPGVVMRLELPMAMTDAGPAHRRGLGDAYAQGILIPYVRKRFVLAVGGGVTLPTATGDLLGAGKLAVAPAVAPLWRLRRGFFFVKVQNVTSVAGDSTRRELNYLLVTPLIMHAIGGRFWMLADSETKTDWTNGGRTGVKSGLQIGRAIGANFGLWVKPEAWWGPNRDGRWNLKFGFLWYQRRSVPESQSDTIAHPAF